MTATSNSGNRGAHDLNAVAAYLEHRLDDEERARFERHLVTCADCRATLALYARASRATGQTLVTTSRVFGVRMAATGWLALAASAVLAIGVSVYLKTTTPGTPTRTPLPTARQPEPPPITAETPRTPPPVQAPAVPAPQPAPAPATTSSATPDGLSKTRGGERRVGDKTFRLEAGAWVDTAYDPLQLLPISDVSTVEKRTALLQDRPALKPYAALGPQVIVVLDGMVYRFDLK